MLGLLYSNWCLFFLLYLLNASSASENNTVVVTSNGPIKGKQLQAATGTVTAYLGIPYAEPPLGKLRFQKPLPHQPWNQVLEATSFGNSCYQRTSYKVDYDTLWDAKAPFSEDCLFLNIWVPHPQPSRPLPVLVWIHGGGYFVGGSSNDMYNGALLAATEKVIVASMNYRLGALGFLFLPPAVPGNMGLWDQWLALKWMKENAAVFGGDPSQLTLIGHSAGASSVGLHLLSSLSQPLFAQAVLQSGAPNAPWAWHSKEKARWSYKTLAFLLECTEKNVSAVMDCMWGKDAGEKAFYDASHLFRPIIDGIFIPDEPQKLLENGLIQAKPLLTGVTTDEGSLFVLNHVPETIENDATLTWEELLAGVKHVIRTQIDDNVVKTLALKYAETSNGPNGYRSTLAHFCRDYYFVCPFAEFAAKMAAAGSSVYVYVFHHHTAGSIWRDWMGVPHGAEVPYLFGTLKSIRKGKETDGEADAALSSRVMHYWAEFARSGNPTVPASSGVQWPLYNATEENFFYISTEVPRAMSLSPPLHCNFLAAHLFNATCSKVSQEDPVSPDKAEERKNETRT